MRRRPRVFHFARLCGPNLARFLARKPPSDWPQHLQFAYEILLNELHVPDEEARRLVIASVPKALACAQSVDCRARMMSEFALRVKVRKSFLRLENCVRRTPASVRRSLNQRMHKIISSEIDSESIEQILEAAKTFCSQCPEHESAQTALRVLGVEDLNGKEIGGLKIYYVRDEKTIPLNIEYSGLGPISRRDCEVALSLLSPTSKGNASAVFKAMASAIDADPPDGVRADVSDLIVPYVAVVARLWRQFDLYPSRATRRGDPKYKSRFHRFVELVLTAMTEPGSNRHNQNIDEIAEQTRAAHAQLPLQIRAKISCALKREDVEWLVSEDHIRKAMRLPAQKMGRDTP